MLNAEMKSKIKVEIEKIEFAVGTLEAIRDDLQNKFDEMSDKWKEGDKGQEAEEKISEFDSAISSLEDTRVEIENLIGE